MEKNTVAFDDVCNVLQTSWSDSEEWLFYEIAWDALERSGLTTYTNEKTHALIYVYAYVLQMIMEEFSFLAYDETFSYEFEPWGDEPLSDAAVGWLYRDCLTGYSSESVELSFSQDVGEMLKELVIEMRYPVTEALFEQINNEKLGNLLYFSVNGVPETDVLQEGETEDDLEGYRFKTKEDLLSYCDKTELCLYDLLPEENAANVADWLIYHTYEVYG